LAVTEGDTCSAVLDDTVPSAETMARPVACSAASTPGSVMASRWGHSPLRCRGSDVVTNTRSNRIYAVDGTLRAQLKQVGFDLGGVEPSILV